jgi:hypothetical protein
LNPRAGSAQARIIKYIDPLVTVADFGIHYYEDAADASVLFPSTNTNPYDRPRDPVIALVNLRTKSFPALIDCLSDPRVTSAQFDGTSITKPMRVPVGYVCLDILMAVARGRPASDPDCWADGLGACMNEGFYFRPDDYSQCWKDTCNLRPWVLIVQKKRDLQSFSDPAAVFLAVQVYRQIHFSIIPSRVGGHYRRGDYSGRYGGRVAETARAGGGSHDGVCLFRQVLQIRQVLRPPASRLVLPQTSQTDHWNHDFLNPDRLFFAVTRFELDSGDRGKDLNPDGWHPHANHVIPVKKQAGGQPCRGEPELAKSALNSGGIFRINVDPRVEVVGGPNRYSTPFELNDFKNSLKSLASVGIAIEGPSQEFERPQPLLDRAGQPVPNRVVRIRQSGDGNVRAV